MQGLNPTVTTAPIPFGITASVFLSVRLFTTKNVWFIPRRKSLHDQVITYGNLRLSLNSVSREWHSEEQRNKSYLFFSVDEKEKYSHWRLKKNNIGISFGFSMLGNDSRRFPSITHCWDTPSPTHSSCCTVHFCPFVFCMKLKRPVGKHSSSLSTWVDVCFCLSCREDDMIKCWVWAFSWREGERMTCRVGNW